MVEDTYEPGDEWTFDEDVTECFDDMLERSIPQYDVMRGLINDVAVEYVEPDTDVVDMGASRGEAIAPLISEFGANNRFVALEVSDPMLDVLRKRFEGMMDAGVVEVRDHDLRKGLPPLRASVVLSVLTVQFVPIEYRQKILADVCDVLTEGGAFIMVEKVLGDTAHFDELFVDRYLRMKAEHGYSKEDIERKRLALEGELVPLTAAENERRLDRAGFAQAECFWRWMNFAGWVAVK